MNKEEFKRRTSGLLRFSAKLDRDVLVKNTEAKICGYCSEPVVNQVIECAVHRIGTDYEHVKHKCRNCKFFVFDASSQSNPYALRKPVNNYITVKDRLSGDTHSIYGNRIGRPRKQPEQVQVKRPVGRPRKPQK
jgi:hypothetical protein